MSDLENSLKQSLEDHPDDWSLRFLVADKILERDAPEEAAELIAAAPAAPETDDLIHRAVEIGGISALPLVKLYINAQPANGYGHTLLAELLEASGDTAKAEQHRSVANALNAASGDSQPGETTEASEDPTPGETPIDLPPIQHIPTPDLAEDAEAPIKAVVKDKPKKQRGAKATAVFVAIGVHLLIALIAMLVVILPPNKDEPEIVAAVVAAPAKNQEMQKKNVVKQTKKTSAASAAAAPIAQLMRANAMAKISLPNVTKTSKGPLGIGDADFGGGGFGSGGEGLGSGASFFGGTSTGQRFLFVLDQSGSMKANQVKLRNAELQKALKSLKGVQYQVFLFAGGGYYASKGWSVDDRNKKQNVVKGPKGTYVFKQVRSYADYKFDGADSKMPKAKWLDSNAANVKMTMERVTKDKLFGGTDWEVALDVAHRMDPPPDVIFFMADGTGGNSPPPILKTNASFGKPPINMVAMQTTQGSKEFAEIARRTKGSFTIVDKKGDPIDGFDYIKNPGKYRGRL